MDLSPNRKEEDKDKEELLEELDVQRETVTSLKDELKNCRLEVQDQNTKLNACLKEPGTHKEELQSAQKDLRESEARLKSVFRAAPVGIGVTHDRILKDVNPQLCQITGYSPEELIGRDARIFYPTADDYEYVGREKYGQLMEIGIGTVETKWKRKDGSIIDILLSSTLIDDKIMRGDVTFTALDITERKQAEEKMRLTQFALENFPDSSIWLSSTGRIVNVNKETCRSLGYTRDELLSLRVWDIDPDTPPDVYSKRWKAIQKRSITFETIHRRKDGSIYPVEVSAMFVEFEDHRYNISFDRDITLRKQTESALKEAKEQAELYVDLMGHDINNMNQVALGFLELALDKLDANGKLDDTDRMLLEKPVESLMSNSQLIDNVRKLKREKSGEIPSKAVDVSAALEEVKTQYSHVKGRDITINYTPVKGCSVKANELLKDVFSNLVGNAIKHSAGGLEIGIALTRIRRNGKAYCEVTIEDNGPGISDNMKDKLLDRACLKRTMKTGKGFGLCLIKSLLDDFNGKIRVEDRVPGDHTKGARFHCRASGCRKVIIIRLFLIRLQVLFYAHVEM